MSAPVANTVPTANAALPGAFGSAAGAQTPVAGFEALLSALFPTGGAVPALGVTKAGKDKPDTETQQSESGAPATDLTAIQAQLAALLAQVPVTQPVAAVPQDAGKSGSSASATPVSAAEALAALQSQAAGGAVPANSQSASAKPAETPALLQSEPPPASPAAATVGAQAAAAPPVDPQAAATAVLPAPTPAAAQPVAAAPAPEAQAVAVKTSKSDRAPADPAAHVPAQATAARTEANPAAAQATPTLTAAAVLAAQSGADSEDQGQSDSRGEQNSVEAGAPDTTALPTGSQPAFAHLVQAQAAATASRGAPETVAKLAAQMIKKLEARTSRFDIALDPVGMGKVDVKVEIGAQGQMTAALSFDSAQSAADLRGRAGELRAALEQAGFDLGSGGLSFSFSGQGGETSRQAFAEPDRRPTSRILQAASADTPPAAAPRSSFDSRPSGVDVRI